MAAIAEQMVWRWKNFRHRSATRGILETPPIVPHDDGVVLFSMIGTKVLLPYLVAVKSFHRNLGRGRVVVLDDGTLTASDRDVLRFHCGDPAIVAMAAVDTGRCPRGNIWERLAAILAARANDYVIQLDSDTVTYGPVPEVAAAIDAGRSFSLRGEATAALMEAGAFVASLPVEMPPLHIQKAAERKLDRLRDSHGGELRYFRGCAGFAGFAPSDAGLSLAEALSATMDRELGRARWGEWGSEQVASNVIVANDPDPLLLPYDRYLNYWGESVPADARLVHFLGTCRYRGRAYADATRAAIAALSDPARAR